MSSGESEASLGDDFDNDNDHEFADDDSDDNDYEGYSKYARCDDQDSDGQDCEDDDELDLDFDDQDNDDQDYEDDDDDEFDFDFDDDQVNDDQDSDSNDDDQVSTLIHSLLAEVPDASSQALLTNSTNGSHIRPSMGGVSLPRAMASPSRSVYGDFIVSFLIAPSFEQKAESTTPFYLCDGLTKKRVTLFVGNVPRSITSEQLKSFFNKRGHPVKAVHLLTSRKRSKSAFIRFTSNCVAKLARLASREDPSKFVLEDNALRINWPRPSPLKLPNIQPVQNLDKENVSPVSYSISDVYYGTLVTGVAMANIHRRSSSIVPRDDEFGLIGHSFGGNGCNVPVTVTLDPEKRTIALVGGPMLNAKGAQVGTERVSFEWRFNDLKGKRITPVVVDRILGEQDSHSEVFLLMTVNRPPTILITKKTSKQPSDRDNETRLPGNQLIGHANAWLFRLSSTVQRQAYEELFKVLNKYDLTQQQFSALDIGPLIGTPNAAQKNLDSMRLLPNNLWVDLNREKVRKFLEDRWPSYPFETKFEIMKLISKHIITVNELVVDEAAEGILKKCSISTVIACTDKIIEFAPRCLSGICDDAAADWNEEEQEKVTEAADQEQRQNTAYPSFDGKSRGIQVRSGTGQSFHVSDDGLELVSPTTLPETTHLGTLSRLLTFSLHELKEKHQLRTDANSGLLITKDELRWASSQLSLIRKIYITPSGIVYEGPYREEKCAVTRHYEQQQDQFLRVAFRDEDFRFLHNYNDNMSKMYERIKQMLIKGVTICDRKYEFLAFSSSQLREHSCWMFASLKSSVSAQSIRTEMGDFRNIRPLAKYAARLGQSFSTSIKGIVLESHQFREIPDYKQTDWQGRTLCFSDGVGVISPWMAAKLAKKVKSSDSEWCPSAFQIRCGGYKGMVCLDVANIISDSKVGVCFRPSMNKFTAKNHSIDVVRVASNPSLAYLNRQIILILSAKGIADDVFLSLQKEMLERSLALTQEPKKAYEALRDLNEFGGNGFHTFLIDVLSKLGKHKEPFTQRLLYAVQAFLIQELRKKAKILVPNSWSLFGVVDDTGILEYGQCFVQIHNHHRQGSVANIVEGPVVVTRNPCFHPGDIRRLEGVDVPQLHGLKNVIVFPRNGVRPHAMEMSGGDLDGDTFWVCQAEQLIFQNNEEPFDYQDQEVEAQKKAQSEPGTQFTIEDVCNFFGDYIEADNLGMIANSHLAFADQSPLKAKDEKCLTLARMHSTAVDFAKNGVAAPRLTNELRPQLYPHFMEKKDKPRHDSTTILGKLYDDIANRRIDLVSRPQADIRRESSFPYQSFYVPGDEGYIVDANVNKHEYERELMRVMRQYGIKREEEIVSGYIPKLTSKQYYNQTNLFELRNEIAHAYRGIRDKYLHIFWREFYEQECSGATVRDPNEAEEDEESDASKWSAVSKKLTWNNQYDLLAFNDRQEACGEKVKKKASAWFRTTYEPRIRHIHEMDQDNKSYRRECPEFFSFAWLVYPVLLDIYRENRPDSGDEFRVTKRVGRKRRRHIRKRKGMNNDNATPIT